MANDLRWGIFGCGPASHEFVHAMRLCESPNIIKAVGAANLSGRVQDFIFREELSKDVKACDTYEDLLRDPNVDIIYIAVESSAHCDLVCRAAEVGKHVLCEKPMGLNCEEIQKMKQSAKQHNTFLMESHSSCFYPAWRALNRGIGSKEFGHVRIISAHIGANDTAHNGHSDAPRDPLLDIGIYPILFALSACHYAKPTAIDIIGSKSESSANITLEFNGGAQKAYLVYTTEAATPNGAYVSLDNGIYQIPEWFWRPCRLVKIHGAPQVGKPQAESFHFPLKNPLGMEENDEVKDQNGSHFVADHVYECIKAGRQESPIMPLKNSVRIREVMEEIRRQINEKSSCNHTTSG
ncbi:oxidoreductase family, NAD-binding rossmann fold domain-containing protein [Ditylenchus destructor]|nr:oxidoreductase family, NAD-binding rossmann fold domain-containing protein [Ditylenchus destructor]